MLTVKVVTEDIERMKVDAMRFQHNAADQIRIGLIKEGYETLNKLEELNREIIEMEGMEVVRLDA